MHYIDYKCKEENYSQSELLADSLNISNYGQYNLPSKKTLMTLSENLKCSKLCKCNVIMYQILISIQNSMHIWFSNFTHFEIKMI